jgi:tripartite-type tricarboxylate transporter receptor subunit TctC
MTMTISRRGLLAAAAALPLPAIAQVPDGGVIRIVVPFAPGGAGDLVARLVAERLDPILDRRIIVENRGGAGGNIGARAVAAAARDGTTLLMGAANNFTINQHLFRNMGFDPVADLAPLGILADVPAVILTNAATPARTLTEFVELARARPGALNYGSPSVGTTPHLGAELLAREAGIRIEHVPYASAGQAITALLAGDIQLYLVGHGPARPHLDSGRVRALAVAAPERLPTLPDVPTTAEQGLPRVLSSNWWGVATTAGTPTPTLAWLAAAFDRLAADEAFRARILQMGFVPAAPGREAMARRVAAEAATWGEVVRAAGIRVE